MNVKSVGRSGSEGAWVAAVIVIAICVLSSFTLSKSGASDSAAGSNGGRRGTTAGSDSQLSVGDQAGDQGGAGGTSVSGDDGSGGGSSTSGGSAAAAGKAGAAGGGAGATAAGGKKPAGAGSKSILAAAADCKGNGNRASDVGVTNNSINFAATVVKTGIAKDFLLDAIYGMQAVQKQINQAGGICGRLINIHEDDDGWNVDNGNQLIQKYIACNCYFGLAVNPSSEGLRTALDSGTIDQAQFPVVGSDGMLIDQYRHPWIWPIATSTHSAMHVIGADAATRGAKKVGIVYDQNYKFGKEGNDAVVGAVTRKGASVVVDKGVTAGQTSYKNDVKSFVDACGADFGKCDYVAMLLEPGTADQWVRDGGLGDGSHHPALGIGAPQPLFLNSFANDCGAPCNGLRVWTGFKPPIPPFDSDENVHEYAGWVAAVNNAADVNNPEVEGAFQGMLLLVQSLAALGPSPTRQALKSYLDSATLDTGLGPAATFHGSNHFAATAVQPFDAVYRGNSFSGWRFPTGAGFVADQEVDRDMPAS